MRLLLLAFGLVILALVHGAGRAGEEQNGPVASLELGSAAVGQPGQIRWRLTEPETGEPFPARLTLAITHLEEGRRLFFLNNVPTDGEFNLQFHFTDGAQYRVTSLARIEGGEPIREEGTVAVTAREPPRQAIFPSLFLFLLVIALGLAAGRLSCNKGLLDFVRPRSSS